MTSFSTASMETESAVHSLFNSIDVPFCIVEMRCTADRPLDFRYVETNDAFTKRSVLGNVDGRSMRQLGLSEDDQLFERIREVIHTGRAAYFQHQSPLLGNR